MSDNVDNPFKSRLTSISIGPGIRGIERGVERVVRLEHLAYVEIEAFIIENLVAQMEFGLLAPAVIWSDAKTLPCEIFRGLVDILFAGYPCQPFSTAGKRRGVEDPRHLYPYIERAIRIIRPRICFFENVRGHVTCGLPEVIESLEGLGYRVHWGIYSAEETGAAHKRERVFILAVENSTSFRCGPFRTKSEGLERSTVLDNAGDELGNSKDINEWDEWPKEEWNESIGGSGDLANYHCEGQSQPEGTNKIIGEWPCNGSEGMGDADNPGLQGWISGVSTERSREWPTRKNGPFFRVSRPGEPQQAWEHPRVISRKVESAVGLSSHGYHFREDILRALGNSVYEDTAEIAFITLLKKHRLI